MRGGKFSDFMRLRDVVGVHSLLALISRGDYAYRLKNCRLGWWHGIGILGDHLHALTITFAVGVAVLALNRPSNLGFRFAQVALFVAP